MAIFTIAFPTKTVAFNLVYCLLSIEVKHPRLILFCSELLKSVPLCRYIVMKTNNDECLAQTGIELMTVRSRDRHVTTQPGGRHCFCDRRGQWPECV